MKSGIQMSELVRVAVDTIRLWEQSALEQNEAGFTVAFSGGKDSCVIKRLTELAGVKHQCVYNVTTIDPPELVHFIKQHHPDVRWNHPKRSFFTAVVARGLPTRRFRWCCEEFKESNREPGWSILGVRAEESARRAARWKIVSRFEKHGRTTMSLSPILYWTEDDVWKFIRNEKLPYCSLYDEGRDRIGCIGCSMQSRVRRKADLARWPRYDRLYRKACAQLWERRAGTMTRQGDKEWFGTRCFHTSDEMFEWWLSDESLPPALCGMPVD
jgi:phosphoadenosine phosphosulfate reductase